MTSAPPAEIQTLIDTHIKAFNTQDNNLFLNIFGDTAVVIDGIAPLPLVESKCPRPLARRRGEMACRPWCYLRALVLRVGLLERRGFVRLCRNLGSSHRND